MKPVPVPGCGDRIDFLASESQYIDHITPVWLELPKTRQGTFYSRPIFFDLLINKYGIKPKDMAEIEGDNLTYTSAFGDMRISRNLNRLTIITEHGAGQTFRGVKSPSYIGAIDRAGCVAVFVPAQYQAEKHIWRHPVMPVYTIGCPKMDRRWRDMKPAKEKKTVAFSAHWDCKVAPETRSSFREFKRALPELKKHFTVIGHAHPKAARHMEKIYLKYDIEFVEDFDEVMDRAGLYITDVSSTLYEFASLDRPVVVLNASFYRRDVEHGLRFWEFADVGLQCDHPSRLVETVKKAFSDPSEVRERRLEVVEAIYGVRDGRDAERAAQLLCQIHDQWKS